MLIEFKDIINRHKDKDCIVLAHGPSLNNILLRLKELKEKYILIGCNEWYLFYEDVKPHYWINANNINTVKTDYKLINKYEVPYIYADSVDLTDRIFVNSMLTVEYLPFDQRHFNSKECDAKKYGCCARIIKGRKTIQEELQEYTKSDEHYGTSDTITLHMIALGVLFGCKNIYVSGFDLDYRLGYAKNKMNLNTPYYGSLNNYRNNILKDLNTIKHSANNIKTNIYTLNNNPNYKDLESVEI